MPEPVPPDLQEAELIQHVFYGKLDNLPSLASKIVRIFTSSTFTGKFIFKNYYNLLTFFRYKYGT
jgi:hypothetical protein